MNNYYLGLLLCLQIYLQIITKGGENHWTRLSPRLQLQGCVVKDLLAVKLGTLLLRPIWLLALVSSFLAISGTPFHLLTALIWNSSPLALNKIWNIWRLLFQISVCFSNWPTMSTLNLTYRIWSLKNRFFKFSFTKLQLCFHVQIPFSNFSFKRYFFFFFLNRNQIVSKCLKVSVVYVLY